MTELRTLKVALLGCGNVGAQVARILIEDAGTLAPRTGARLELAGIAVRNLDAEREVDLPRDLFTTDGETLVKDADLVIELMGGIEPARSLILSAIQNGASVVTGTTNFILDQMDSPGAQFAAALAEAQRLGYAEADPTADVEGHDAAAKAAILASLSFHTRFELANVYCEGITKVSAADIAAAKEAGFVIKLLAIAEKLGNGEGNEGVSVRVHPTLLPREHPLAAVRGAFNAVFVEAENAGELMFYGQGAGGTPTASAVLGDLVSAARRIVLGGPGRIESTTGHVPALPIDAATTSYYIGLDVADQPGVLAKIAQLFAEHGVSIEIMRQNIHRDADSNVESAELRIVTHRASEAALAATVEAVKGLDVINSVTSVLRVEGA